MSNTTRQKIPYDAGPIVRDYETTKPKKVQSSIFSRLFICAIFLFNIVVGSTLLMYIINNKSHINIQYNYSITATQGDYATITSKAKLSAVCIGAGKFSSSNMPSYEQLINDCYSRGAGVIISLDAKKGEAFILTCYHVIENYTGSVFVSLYDIDKPIHATTVGYSSTYDIAVLKISDEIIKETCSISATIANSTYITESDTAIAIGNPVSGGFSASVGTVNRPNIITEISGIKARCIQVDTPINAGNSGGGLFDGNGNLIGIVKAKSNSSSLDNIAFALHINFAMSVANNIINGQNLEYAPAGYTAQANQSYIENVGGKNYKFYKVAAADVDTSSDAYKAGLRNGDIIESITYNGSTVVFNTIYTYTEIMFNLKYGDTVTYNVKSGGTSKAITFKVSTLKK